MSRSICDLCDSHPEQVRILEPIFHSYGGRSAFSGPISTIKCHEDNSQIRAAVGEPGEGRVLVVDGGGSMRHALLGDQLAAQGQANGWTGVVIFGAVRDVEILLTLDIGVRALYCFPLRTEKKGIGERDIPIHFAGVNIRPGMYLYADDNGILVADKALD